MLSETNALIFALLGGIVPALFWLWFWLKEDKLRPEPKYAIFSAFVGGIIAVLMALFFELIIYYLLVDANTSSVKEFPAFLLNMLNNLANHYDLVNVQNKFWAHLQDIFSDINVKKMFLVVIIAPIIEETFKLMLTYNICLRKKINDEPIDASIYMLTSALGFAAIETALILTEPLSNGKLMDGFIASNFRSVGPMLIHLISSATVGIFMGLAFYKTNFKKFLYVTAGFIIAIILHATFNFFIVMNDTTHNTTFFWTACLGTWALVAVLLVSFEKVKKVIRPFYLPRKVYIPRSF